VKKIRRAVEWIDMPGVAFVGALDNAGLLHIEPVSGARSGEFFKKRFFGFFVGGGDEVAGAFDRHLQIFNFAEITLQTTTGLDGGSGHHIHQSGADHAGASEL
jgi:hypothetical protein